MFFEMSDYLCPPPIPLSISLCVLDWNQKTKTTKNYLGKEILAQWTGKLAIFSSTHWEYGLGQSIKHIYMKIFYAYCEMKNRNRIKWYWKSWWITLGRNWDCHEELPQLHCSYLWFKYGCNIKLFSFYCKIHHQPMEPKPTINPKKSPCILYDSIIVHQCTSLCLSPIGWMSGCLVLIWTKP